MSKVKSKKKSTENLAKSNENLTKSTENLAKSSENLENNEPLEMNTEAKVAELDFRVTDPTKQVKIVRSINDRVEPLTVPALFKRTVENYGKHTALIFRDEITKKWTGFNYKEYRDRVEKMAKVFIKLGLERHGTVAVLAFNSVEWFVSELAAIHAG